MMLRSFFVFYQISTVIEQMNKQSNSFYIVRTVDKTPVRSIVFLTEE